MSGRPAWKGFRVLCFPKWSEAFVAAVESATGCKEFTYVTAVTKLVGTAAPWEQHQPFRIAMQGNPIKLVTLMEMLKEVSAELSTTMAGTELGRTLQLFRAAGLKL